MKRTVRVGIFFLLFQTAVVSGGEPLPARGCRIFSRAALAGEDPAQMPAGIWTDAELRHHMVAVVPGPEPVQLPAATGAGLKKPAVGILLSALLPGTGEFYAGSWVRGLVFLGVEAALWTGYAHFSNEGQKFEDTFHEYAETHWSETRWRLWMQQHPEFGDTTHTLPSTRTQQYYEMIGKYNQFKAGWDDYADGGPALTEKRDHYENLRDQSNDHFKNASYCAMITLGNRILSVFDTAWIIRGYNRRIQSTLRMDMRRDSRQELSPVLSFTMRW